MTADNKNFKIALLVFSALAIVLMGGCDLFLDQDSAVIDFSWGHALEQNILTIQFLDLSTVDQGLELEYYWDFGDGNTSTAKNPIHKYTQEGSYQVSLKITSSQMITDFYFKEKTITLPLTTLKPGHIFKQTDGVILAAPEQALDFEVAVDIIQVDDPRTEIEFPSYLSETKVISDFFQVTAQQEIVSPSGEYLLLGLPVPSGVNTENLGIAVLSPPNSIVTSPNQLHQSMRWEMLTGYFDQASGLFGTTLPYLGAEKQIFALIEGGFQIAELLQPQHFQIVSVGFQEGEVLLKHLLNTKSILNEAFTVLVNELDYKEPRLRRVITQISFSNKRFWSELDTRYEYQLRKGSLGGWYNITQNTAATKYPGYPAEPADFIAVHELYHALQYAYEPFFQNRSQRNFGVVEGTAVAAELSLQGLTRSNIEFPSRQPLEIHSRLFRADTWMAHSVDYRTQDFWVFVGKKMNPQNPNLKSFIPVFETGGLLPDLDDFFNTEGTFDSLSDAYWQWVKNQSFEKEIILGQDQAGNDIPQGEAGMWSGHGLLRNINYNPDIWEAAAPDPFRVPPLNSRVYQITFFPTTQPYVTVMNIAPAEKVNWKVYTDDSFPQNNNLQQLYQNEGFVIAVDQEQVEIFLLLANSDYENNLEAVEISFTAPERDISSAEIASPSKLAYRP